MPIETAETTVVALELNEILNPNLQVPPVQRKFGNKPDITKNNVTVRIGVKPLVVDLVRAYEQAGRQLPPDLSFFVDHYCMWMILYHVNVMEEPGKNQIRQLVFEVQSPEQGRQPEF